MYSEYLHQDGNLNICNFPIFGLIFTKFSNWQSFCLIFNWERANIRPQIGIGKSLQWHLNANATDDHGICTTTYVRARWGLTAFKDTLLRSYGDHTAIPRCLYWACSKCALSAFYVIPQGPLAMPLCCCVDACNRTECTSAICIFLGHLGIAIPTLLCCDRGFRDKSSGIYCSFATVIKRVPAW